MYRDDVETNAGNFERNGRRGEEVVNKRISQER